MSEQENNKEVQEVKDIQSVKIDVNKLLSLGAILSNTLIKKSVNWVNGDNEYQFEVYIRKHSFGVVEKMFKDKEESRGLMSQYIADTVFFDENAKTGFTYEQAFNLESSFAGALILAINEVNSLQAKK